MNKIFNFSIWLGYLISSSSYQSISAYWNWTCLDYEKEEINKSSFKNNLKRCKKLYILILTSHYWLFCMRLKLRNT